MPRPQNPKSVRLPFGKLRNRAHDEAKIHNQSNPTVPIIALTASAFEEERQSILAAGCDDFLRKPFCEEELFSKMSEYLGVRYLYAEDASRGNPVHQSALVNSQQLQAYFVSMPEAWVEQLHFAAAQCSQRQLLEAIAQIPPAQVELATALRDLVENFRFDIILEASKGK